MLERVFQSFGSSQAACEQFPFLVGYCTELHTRGVKDLKQENLAVWWRESVIAWENSIVDHLPLRALCDASGLDYSALTLLLTVGLIEEDTRFGSIFDAFQTTPGYHRPTIGLLNAWWQSLAEEEEPRAAIRQLLDNGLVQVVNPDAPRSEWALQVPSVLWDMMRGEVHEALTPWAHYHAPHRLVTYD